MPRTAKPHHLPVTPPVVIRPAKKSFKKRLAGHTFAQTYLALAIVVLLVTTLLWSVLGATLNQANADQLVDPYLFRTWPIFHGAMFPGAHTFLLKWPLFMLINFFGVSSASLNVFTVIVVLVTVGALAIWLYRIERRPLVLGTLYMALAGVLLLVPTQPYAGGILPVNMAMLTTRNLEYLVYALGLIWLVRSSRLKSWRFIGSVIVFGILFASDKLFMSFSIGGAMAALVVYALSQNWRLVTLCVRWLVAGILAAALAMGILALINLSGITHVVNGTGATPYGVVQGAKNGVLAVVYAFLGLFTNFGANPAYDATQLRHLPLQSVQRLFSLSGPAYLLNAVLVVIGLIAAYRLWLASLFHKKSPAFVVDRHFDTALLLLWSSLAAVGVFVASNHYYAVDARYLAISFFAIFVTLAVAARKRKWRAEWLAGVGLFLFVGVICASLGAVASYRSSRAAMQPITARDNTVAQVLAQHHVNVIVGDYWRVLPIKLQTHNRVRVAPLASCTNVREGLTSSQWAPDLHRHSFAYLMSLDRSLTDFPSCNLKQVVTAYGTPNATVLIAGNASKPKELLLFYDRGIQPVRQANTPPVISTVTPIQMADLRNTSCEGPTTLAVVAHQDDDLLFMNPDQLHDVAAGHCMRTIYLTAGDGGNDKFYWLSREQGSEAAYDALTGAKKGWVQQTVQLPEKQYVTVASPQGNSKISLIFMHLPDGNLNGRGFSGTNFESLQSLFTGGIPRMHTVDHQSSYTSAQLVAALHSLMDIYQPSLIRTQATVVDTHFPDHSDHMATSEFTQKAYEQYEKTQYENTVTIPIMHYIGYPIRDMPANVTDGDLAKKQAAFFAYAHFDGAVCYSMRDCRNTPTYWEYLSRQYTQQ